MTRYAIGPINAKTLTVLATGELDAEGTLHFDVINGGWSGTLDAYGVLRINDSDDSFDDQAVLWSGEVPRDHAGHFNEAIPWINEQLARRK